VWRVAVSTQALVAFGSCSVLDNDFLLGISIAFGFDLAVLTYSVAPISREHINPSAMLFAFFLLKDLPLTHFISYIFAQCATLGAALVWGSFASPKLAEYSSDNSPPFLVGSNLFGHSDIPLGSAFWGEMMGPSSFVLTVLMTAVSVHSIAGNLAPIVI
jgi:glycerol uptake facilitator-like aquaporin